MLRTANWLSHVTASGVVTMVAALGLAACNANGPSAPIVPGIHMVLEGRAERGATMSAHLVPNAPPDLGRVTWTTNQPWAVADSMGQVRLTDIGVVTVTAHAGSASTQATLRVSAPPTIVFDMHDVDPSHTLGNRNVYRAALDGGELTRLSTPVADNIEPTAVRGVVVFTSFRNGYPALYSAPLTGTVRETRLTAITGPANQPTLSADGSRLAFVVPGGITYGGPPNPLLDKVWIAAADGSKASRATVENQVSDGAVLEAGPTWAPGADTLALVTTAQGPAELEKLVVRSNAALPLTSGGATTDVEPAWSTDGRTVAFTSTRDGDQAIFTLDVASGTVRRMSPTSAAVGALDGQPTWLPDGRLVYTAWSFAGGSLSSTLRWIDPATPDAGHDILLPAGMPEHAAAVR